MRLLTLATLIAFVACRASTPAGSSASAEPSPSMATATIPTAPRPAPRPAQVTPAQVTLGDSLFNTGSCQRCHGAKGVGAGNGPALNGTAWSQLTTGSYDEIVQIITTGVPVDKITVPTRRFAMRPRGGPMNLDDAQVAAVAAYVWTLRGSSPN